jgi:predicted site-specific integrase-resolvase
MKPKLEDDSPGASGTLKRFSKARTIAGRLGVCPRTIFRWADSGKITRHKINSRVVLFDEAEIADLIRAARIESNN